MKKLFLAMVALALVTPSFGQKGKQTDSKQNNKKTSMKEEFKTFDDSVSYVIGYNIAKNLKAEQFKFDPDKISAGLKDGFTEGKGLYSDEEISAIMMEWQSRMEAAQNKANSGEIEKNKAEGVAFLEKNKKDKDVHVTPSGLQYKVVVAGEGAKPKATDQVKVHYKGTLLDGTVFDSSIDRGEPITFPLNQVIPGWTEGVQLMPVGSTYIFYIPSNLGYGDRGAGPVIKGGSTLIFEVQLLDINPTN